MYTFWLTWQRQCRKLVSNKYKYNRDIYMIIAKTHIVMKIYTFILKLICNLICIELRHVSNVLHQFYWCIEMNKSWFEVCMYFCHILWWLKTFFWKPHPLIFCYDFLKSCSLLVMSMVYICEIEIYDHNKKVYHVI